MPLWPPSPVPYSQLTVVRDYRYKAQGPSLLRDIVEELDALEVDPGFAPAGSEENGASMTEKEWAAVHRIESLARLNELSLELGAINTEWFEFSTAVFSAFMSPGAAAVKALRPLFQQTLARLAGRA